MPTGTLYKDPIHITTMKVNNAGVAPRQQSVSKGTEEVPKSPRQQDDQHIAGVIEEEIPDIPRSPNRFETLTEEGREPRQVADGSLDAHMELVKEIIAAIPPNLVGQQCSGLSHEPTPFVNSDRCLRSRSRDPRRQRGGDKIDEATDDLIPVTEEGDAGPDGTEVPMDVRVSSAPGTGKKKKHAKHLAGGHPRAGNYGTVVSTSDDDVVIRTQLPTERQDEDIDAEAVGRLSRAKGGKNSANKNKSKLRSRSGGKKQDEDREIPSNWEDGAEDDPGVSQ